MSLRKNLKSRFYNTKVVKDFLTDIINPKVKKAVEISTARERAKVEKAQPFDVITTSEDSGGGPPRESKASQFRGIGLINRDITSNRKPFTVVPFSFMRRLVQAYPIARACINRRIGQVTQLEWEILEEKGNEEGRQTEINAIKEWLKHPFGHKSTFRDFLTVLIDDVLTIDAVSFEYKQTRGGEFMHLVPVDPTTIVLRVTQSGSTPEPPDIAYAQILHGHNRAQFNTDELFYGFMRRRSLSPYGFAPVESLIIQVESALNGSLFNLTYFRENNIPEGFVTLPEEVAENQDQVREWQLWFDTILSGDFRKVHRLKMLPGGSEYTPVKKPEDMAFERFEKWLMMQTCAVFDVPPRDIGITTEVNKASDETQHKLSIEKGLLPLANYIKEFVDMIIQEKFGFTGLEFGWTDINPVDRMEEIDIAEKEIRMGGLTPDEYRVEHGREPNNTPRYISGKVTFLNEDGSIMERLEVDEDSDDDDSSRDNPKDKDEDKEKLVREDLKKWRKRAYNDVERGSPVKTNFISYYIPKTTKREIAKALKNVDKRHQVKLLFDRFLDQELGASFKLLKLASQMRRIEDADFLEQ